MNEFGTTSGQKSATIPLALTLGLLLIAYSSLLYLMPKNCFWITDGGNKFIQLRSFPKNGSFSVDYPAQDIDPHYRFFPRGGHHFKLINGEMHSFYPPYFPLASLPFYQMFGWEGLFIIPLLSTIFCFVYVFRMQQLFSPSMGIVPLLFLGFATPLFFYSLTFWEHTLAVLFSTASIYLSMRVLAGKKDGDFLALAGGLLGLSAIFREESYILFVAVLGAVALYSNRRKKRLIYLIGGFLTITIPLWVFQYMIYGHFLGLHPVIYSSLPGGAPLFSIQGVKMKILNFFVYMFRFHAGGLQSKNLTTVLLTPFIIASAAGLTTKTNRRGVIYLKIFIIFVCAIASLVLSFLLIKNPEPVINTLWTQSLVSSIPFLAIFFVCMIGLLTDESIQVRFMTFICMFYIFVTCICLNQKDMGIVWSARHFLGILPLLILLSYFAFLKMLHITTEKNARMVLITAIGLLTFSSLVIQGHGIRTLFIKKHASAQLVQAASRVKTDIILTDIFWLPGELAGLYHSKKIMQVRSDQDFQYISDLLRTKNIKEYTLVLSPNPFYRTIRNKSLQQIATNGGFYPGEKVSVSGAEFMAVQFFYCKLNA